MHYRALMSFYFVYFITYSIGSFLPKYYGEIGLSDGQIGMLISIPAIVAVFFQPYLGVLTDRARLKRNVIIGLLTALTAVSLVLHHMTGFTGLLIGLVVFIVLELPIGPAYATITLEYTREIGRTYGPVRMIGTIGYQVGALVAGALLANSLRGIFLIMAGMIALSCLVAFLMPPIKGHQHGREKVSMRVLFSDRHLVLLLVMILIGTVTSQFYLSFFSKHLGDLGIDNASTGMLLFVSVLLELPFLAFADRLARKTSIWNWLLIAYGLNAIRWLGLSVSRSVLPLLLFQLPAVSVMACFEFFPALYVIRRVPDTLRGSAQTTIMVTSFGVAKVIGSLLGGFVSERVGIPTVFAFNGAMLLVMLAVFWKPTRRMIARDALADVEG